MNRTRIFIGGLAAAIVINASEAILNVPVLGNDCAEAMAALGKPGDFGAGQIALFNVMGFLSGIALVWLYAAIRPRYGAGPRTAVCAGAAIWFLSYALPSVGQIALDLWPLRAMAIALAWGVAEMIVAGLVGGWLYREPSPL